MLNASKPSMVSQTAFLYWLSLLFLETNLDLTWETKNSEYPNTFNILIPCFEASLRPIKKALYSATLFMQEIFNKKDYLNVLPCGVMRKTPGHDP